MTDDSPAAHDALAELLGRQNGIVSRRQLAAIGFRSHDVKRLLRRRTLTRVHPGVYVEHTGPLTWPQRAWAAVLALWPAALCGESAIHDGATPGPAPIQVAIDRARRSAPPPGVRLHRIARLDERVLWNRSPPRLRYEDAVLDLAGRAGSDFAALGVLTEACRSRRTTPERLVDTLARRAWAHRRAWLTAVLADLAAGATSVLEHCYATAVERAHGLPAARRQVRVVSSPGVIYRNVEYPSGLVVELDGRLIHNTVTQRDADFERDLDAALDGRTTVRLSWGQVVDRPCRTAAKLARLLRHQGWSGTPHPCGPTCPIADSTGVWRIRSTG